MCYCATFTYKKMAGSTTKETVDGLEIDISSQENVSQRPGNLGRSSKQQVRHRASIACFSCRDRRIRCVVPKGGSGCIQCKRSGTECVIKMDDERRRPISKAYVSSLSSRIAMLESMLQEKGVAVPPSTHPPMTKHEAQSVGSGDEIRISAIEARRRSKSDAGSPIRHILSPPYSHEDFAMYESPMEDLANNNAPREESIRKEQSPFRTLDLKEEDVMHRLFFPNGGLSCDRLSGKLRFFGSTANCHVYAESPSRYHSKESPEQIRRAERIIRSLTPKTHDYLMQSFWKYHNSVLQVIDRAAFEADRGSENPKYYSSFLHIIILAVGWRFADKDRYDIARINLGNYESTLHREARHMLDIELERPMGIPSVQSLLLLGDLECGVGRDNTGWMYTGMASHLASDIGLHVDCSNIGLSKREVSVRRRAMRACFLYDRYWALFLGRPTSIKSRDLAFDISKTADSTCSVEHNPSIPPVTQTIEEEIYEQLVRLMILAGKIVESQCETKPGHDANQATSWTMDEAENSMDILTLDQELRDWYERLPNHLAWRSDNIGTAPCGYFLLHGQYHAIMILLHRSRGAYGLLPSDGPISKSPSSPNEAKNASEFSANSEGVGSHSLASFVPKDSAKTARDICTQAAIQFAQIISQYREKYDLERTCCTSLQPAGTASIALLAATAYSKDERERRIYLSSLETVSNAVQVMSRSYQPAVRMENLIQSVLAQLSCDTRDSRHSHGDSFEQGTNDGKNSAGTGFKDAGLVSFLPVRQEHRDRDTFLQNHDRIIPAQVTPGSARPPPPFHVSPNPYYNQNSLNNQSNNMSGLLPGFPDALDTSLYLDLLCAPTTSADSIYASRHGSDNYLRVAPSAKGWGLHSLHAAIQPEQPASDFDSHMPDWIGESTNFDDSTTLQGPKFDDQNASLSTNIGSDLDNKNLPTCKREDTGGLVWMNNEVGLRLGTPASPQGFVQEPEPNREGKRSPVPPRNHELDYLSL
ncbi:fungal-specific transcription factor domain-containing protein [Xylaria cf. heliscus]|nr:fungal-specific transcription factor domain-containing protein [Xylaria cf. heliscus]